MKFKKLYGKLALTAIAAMFVTACSENVEPNQPVVDHSKMTCFGSGEVLAPVVTASADGLENNFMSKIRKISMAAGGKFSWVEGDRIWVKKDGSWVNPNKMEITANDNWADFYFNGAFDEPTYEVRYTGTSESPDVVTITSEQVQKVGNNSEHYASCGDAAWGIAQKLEDLKYRFNFKTVDGYTGNHEAAYIYFEPRTDVAPATDYCKVRKIRITETNGKNICGTYNFSDETGHKLSDETRTADGGNVITIYCGEDVKAVDDETLSPAVAQHNGFPIKEVKDPDKNRAFLVLQPGTYSLKIEYEVAHYLTQTTSHNDETEFWTPKYEEFKTTITKNISSFTYEPNKYYSMGHKLNVKKPESIDVYPFKQYYMWGAENWFWKGAENLGIPYPVYNDSSQVDGAPAEGSSSWYFDSYTSNDICVGSFNGSDTHMYVDRSQGSSSRLKAKLRKGMRRDQLKGDWGDNVLNANEMSFYVVFGDPYYDNKTPWILEEYNGGGTVCYGGVWLLKKDRIIATTMQAYNDSRANDYEKVVWPSHNDGATHNDDANCYSAPYPDDAVDYFDVDDKTKSFIREKLHNQQFNLRYMAPPFNFRKRYTNAGRYNTCWSPKQDGKNIDDYFFVPCLGRFEYDNRLTAAKAAITYPTIGEDGEPYQTKTTAERIIEGTGDPTLTLVGSQGYYWTRTPLMFNYFGSGGTGNEKYGTRFYRYVYDEANPAKLLSSNSYLDKFTFDATINQRYATLYQKRKDGTLTTAEEVELTELESKYVFNEHYTHGHGYSQNAIRNLYRYATYGTWNDNAYYLNIHHDYLALSWQQHSIYVKTGMRKATTGTDGIFK